MNRVSFQARILGILGLACALSATVALLGFSYFNRKSVVAGMISRQRTIQAQLTATTQYIAELGGLQDKIQKMLSKYSRAEELTKEDRDEVMSQVPIVSALRIGARNAKSDHYTFRVFSDEPRNKENMATASEMKIYEKFLKDPTLEEFVETHDDTVTTFKPVRLTEAQGCLTCHGNPRLSPWKNGKDILGYPMENWSDGKLHGVFAVSQSVSEVQKAAVAGHLITPQGWLMMAICLGAALSVFAGFLMVRKPLQNIRGVSKILSETSRSVDEAAKGITSLSHSLAQASHEQAAALQETSASIEEMSSMVQKNSDNAKESAKQSENSKIIAMNGREIVGQMIQSIGEIRMSNQAILQQIEASNTEIGQIVKLIQEIGSKTRVINDIVFQTKLLSFNASVEAARAGEHGKGFAVVAEEVGNLAQMSGNAAKEISSMLENGIQSVERIVRETQSRVGDLIRQGEQKIESGSEVATQCGQALQEILAQVEEVTRMAQEISTASQEQAQGVHELTQAMNQLDQATQQNSQTSQNAAGSATKLSQQSEELRRAIGDLERVLQGGTNTDSVPPSESRGGNSPLERIQGPRLAA